MPQEQPNPQKPSSQKKPLDDYARYSTMGLTMAAAIGLGAWGGMKLDAMAGNKKVPVFTLVLSLFAVGASMWYFISDVLKRSKKK